MKKMKKLNKMEEMQKGTKPVTSQDFLASSDLCFQSVGIQRENTKKRIKTQKSLFISVYSLFQLASTVDTMRL